MNRQFNIKGINGLYLSYKPNTELNINNYESLLLKDNDFFPNDNTEALEFNFTNSQYTPTSFLGSNSIQKSNSSVRRSEINTQNKIISNRLYYNKFKFYFRFYGSTLENYSLPNLTTEITKKILNRLRVKLYVDLGGNLASLILDNLERLVLFNGNLIWRPVDNSTDVWTIGTGYGGVVNNGDYGVQLFHSNNEDCIDLAYLGIDPVTLDDPLNIDEYQITPDGYNFRVDVSVPNFLQKSGRNKNYKIIVKYFNIGITDNEVSGSTYSISESIELMSNSFILTEEIESPTENITNINNFYDVTFYDFDNNVIKIDNVIEGGSAIPPLNMELCGYTFDGWSEDFTNVTTPLNVEAQYTLTGDTHIVTFLYYPDPNDTISGTTIDIQSILTGCDAEAPTPPIITGYTFDGWGVDFTNVTTDLDVYALYTINTYTVTFIYYIGNAETNDPFIVNYGDTISFGDIPNGNQRTGYTFVGWDPAVTGDIENITSNMTITALYTED